MKMGQTREQPHRKERDRRPEGPARFRYKTTAAGTKHAVHSRDGTAAIGQNRKEARCDENVERIIRMRQLQDVVTLKTTMAEIPRVPLFAGPTQLACRAIDPEH